MNPFIEVSIYSLINGRLLEKLLSTLPASNLKAKKIPVSESIMIRTNFSDELGIDSLQYDINLSAYYSHVISGAIYSNGPILINVSSMKKTFQNHTENQMFFYSHALSKDPKYVPSSGYKLDHGSFKVRTQLLTKELNNVSLTVDIPFSK